MIDQKRKEMTRSESGIDHESNEEATKSRLALCMQKL